MDRQPRGPTLGPAELDTTAVQATFSASTSSKDLPAVEVTPSSGHSSLLRRFGGYLNRKIHLASNHDAHAKPSPQPRSATLGNLSQLLNKNKRPPVSLATTLFAQQLASAHLGDNQFSSLPRGALPISDNHSSNNNREEDIVEWSSLRTTLKLLHGLTGWFPPLQSATEGLINCLEIVEAAARNRSDYAELAINLNAIVETLISHLHNAKSTRMSNCIVNFSRGIQQEIEGIREQQSHSATRRLIGVHSRAEDLIKRYRRIGALFKRLETDARLSLWSLYDEDSTNKRLDGLAPAKLAHYNSTLSEQLDRHSCALQTCVKILWNLQNWSRDEHAAKLHWMRGMPGTGKTTIAFSFAEALEEPERRHLAATFFCARSSPECQDTNRIIPTIAYQLARYSTPFQWELYRILGQDPDLNTQKISTQFDRLLKDPLIAVKDAIPDNAVVIIDALDECSNERGVTQLVDLLLKHAPELPLKFFITCRPDADIYYRIASHKDSQSSCSITDLRTVGQSMVQQDIETYLQNKLGFLLPTPSQIEQLVQRSGCLFIYAATIVRYIQPDNPRIHHKERFQSILAMTSSSTDKMYETIDPLYEVVVQSVFEEANMDTCDKDTVRKVLWTVLCARESINIDTIGTLAGLTDKQQVRYALESLASVISLSEDEHVSTLHTTFIEFMLDPKRSRSLCCNKEQYNGSLTRQCFNLMKDQLRFNICDLESPHQPDESNPLIKSRVNDNISPALLYACRYWVDHLGASDPSSALSTSVNDFLSHRLLFWMEVLNLKRLINEGEDVLFKAMIWLKARDSSSDIIKLAEDARNFVTGFAANKLSICTPHIYISALPFCHRLSSVFEKYSKRVPRLLKVRGSLMEWRRAAPLASSSWGKTYISSSFAFSPDGSLLAAGSIGDEGQMISVRNTRVVDICRPFLGPLAHIVALALSSDGKYVACASNDFKVQAWDVQNGAPVTKPLDGHTAAINSLSFSGDGIYIASGSSDRTIRIHYLSGSESIILRKNGVGAPIKSVSFSPDGEYIISGGDNSEILLWRMGEQSPISNDNQFKGHTSSVNSVAFSPDSQYVVSGSSDCTIRVWSSAEGQAIFKLIDRSGPNMHGHTDPISSVRFSPDGLRIVSASLDSTIRVWETQSGDLITGPFEGPCQIVAVTFSGDGTRIISASHDCKIQTWNAHCGVLSDNTARDDKYAITSVEVGPNGQQIVTGCSDGTIRVWNSRDGASDQSPLRGHNGAVRAIAWSPNNSIIASGSDDWSIRFWDLQKHPSVPVTSPLLGHKDWVWSVSFSPDGTKIVSGSNDCTIRVWSTLTGELLLGPLEGSTNPVSITIFSSDGTSIISGSNDSVIRVHNVYSGAKIFEKSFGEQSTSGASLAARAVQSRVANPVVSALVSLDTTPINSGSKRPTIQTSSLGNEIGTHGDALTKDPSSPSLVARNKATARDLLHTNVARYTKSNQHSRSLDFTAVAFSFDSRQVAFGCGDCSIHVWNILEHIPAIKTLQGHTSPVSSLAFSRDNTKLVSAAPDGTVRVWDVRKGVAVAGPFHHVTTGAILSVCFSPDGTSVVSGCENSTVFVWDICVGESGVSPIDEDEWNVEDDGWVITPKSERLFWLPQDIACYKPTQRTKLVIGPHGAICIDHQDLLKGRDWRQFDSPE